MKTVFALTMAAAALASCSSKTETTVEPTAAETVATAPTAAATQAPTGSMAGTYEMTAADGTRTTQTVNADGSFSQISNGKEVAGTWRMDGAKSCFDPAGDVAEVCYTTTPIAADGTFTATHPDGSKMTVRKIAAAPAT